MQKLKNPKSIDAYKIADTFKLLAEAKMGRVDILETRVPAKEYVCGSSACHAGWFAISALSLATRTGPWDWRVAKISFSTGAEYMAKTLGFRSAFDLEDWAADNPKIWGNYNGERMFGSDRAFTTGRPPTLGKIARHWYGVASRLEALEKANG